MSGAILANDELKLRKDMERAAQAEALLRNELVSEAFKDLEAVYLERWRATKPGEHDNREKLYMAVRVVGEVKDHLQQVVTNGALSQRKLEEFAPKPKRFGIV